MSSNLLMNYNICLDVKDNPLIYIYQKRIANLHEFIADSKAVKLSNKVSYYQNLLAQVFDTQRVAFINPFFKQ